MRPSGQDRPTGCDAALSAHLEAALVRHLAATWKHLNWDFFREALTMPTLTLSDATSTLGRWVRQVRTIEISRRLVLEHPWGVVVEVLKHEMAHQYVDEVLGGDATPHGSRFREVCRTLGIDGAADGIPTHFPEESGGRGADHRIVRILDRIAKLLALAKSANLHEAEAATAAAQKLMLKYNLAERSALHARGYGWRQVGTATGRVGESARILSTLLATHFFVEAIWVPAWRVREGKRASILELCGTPANLEIAVYVHDYLNETAERLWRDHRNARRIGGDRDRRTFLAGVMSGFAAKLARQSARHRSEGLVWVRDADLTEFYRRRHPHVLTVRYGGARRSEAWAEGRAAGESIVLHRGVKGGPVARGRMLGP